MRSLLALILLVAAAGLTTAGDHCFVQPYAVVQPYGSYQQPYVYEDVEITQVDVINRQLRLQPAKAYQKDTAVEQIFALEYQKVLEAIPLTPRKQVAPLRRFEFKNNTPAYVAKQQVKKQQSFQTETVTQTFQAVVQQNVVVHDGNVLLDVPPHILEKIIPVEVKPINQK